MAIPSGPHYVFGVNHQLLACFVSGVAKHCTTDHFPKSVPSQVPPTIWRDKMHDWFVVFVNTVVIVLAIRYGGWKECRRKELPYKWVCPEKDCAFKVSSSDPVSVAKVTDNHLQRMHGR